MLSRPRMEGKWFAGGLQVTVLRLAPIPTPHLAPLPQVDFSTKTTARAVWRLDVRARPLQIAYRPLLEQLEPQTRRSTCALQGDSLPSSCGSTVPSGSGETVLALRRPALPRVDRAPPLPRFVVRPIICNRRDRHLSQYPARARVAQDACRLRSLPQRALWRLPWAAPVLVRLGELF